MTGDPHNHTQQVYRVLDLTVDLDREVVSRDDQSIDLSDLSFRLLAVLIRHAPETVSKDDLIREVWGDVVVTDETLAQRVRLLRQALGEDGAQPRFFSSVRGRGYRLVCEVKPVGRSSGRDTSVLRRSGIALAGLALIAIAALWLVSGQRDESTTTQLAQSIAVLPFSDLSADGSYRHFADGMQEELLTRLTAIGGLRVSSRTTVEPYRTTNLSLPEIAEEIGADAIIEGSVRVDDDRIRITVQLIDAESDQHLLAENFDRRLSVQGIFSIQDEVARRIAHTLKLEYSNAAGRNALRLPTASLDAYSAYLMGRYHTFRQTQEDLELAIGHLGRATTLDPDFAEAFAALGWAYGFLGTNYGNWRPQDAYPKARAAALRALALDSGLGDARSLYADILTWYDWDFIAAEQEYLRALEFDPLNILGYALFLSTQERHEEALELIERRLQVDSEDPYVRINAAWRFLSANQVDRAIMEAEHAGSHTDARAALGFARLAMGDNQRAISIFEADLEDQGRLPPQLSNLAVGYFSSGMRSDGRALLAELEHAAAQTFVSPALLAAVYFADGEDDKGFAALQDAVDARVRDVIFLRVARMLDGHRDDPRYLVLLKAIGLSAEQ